MIDTPTLFILGAGASVPYGLPTGQRLREEICKLATSQGDPFRLLFKGFGWQEQVIKVFAEEFAQSGLNSIDAFLARRADREEIGKAAIAACLLTMEQGGRLNAVDDVLGRSDWYGELWNRMMDDVVELEQLVKGNHIRFATFNYDRSLEAFLHQSVKATFNLNDDQAYAIWSQFPIHHIYGSLGDFGPTNRFTYGVNSDSALMRYAREKAVKSIKVVPAARQEEKDKVVVENVHWAERVLTAV